MITSVVCITVPVLTEDVGKLRTSPPLFQAYEHAYSILENKLCPLFHASDDVSLSIGSDTEITCK